MLADDKPGVMHAGTTMVVAFHLSGDGRAAYVLTGRDESRMDICLIEASERGFWEQGMKTRGYACHDDVNMARDSASLPEGNYYLALRCENVFADCDFSYSLKLHG
ncbi:MAG TPA: hypothetical protein VNZ52_06665 [Candidatus Thermoplasmatota archaeon]|nr:hypothetical protein [Candidatus Thermoplasmatota archaeon]